MKNFTVSQRAKNAPSSPVRKFVPFADLAKKKGISVYHINIGDPDFETPRLIQDTLKVIAKNLKRIPYASSKGLESTLEAWQKYYQGVGIKLSLDEILITNGGSESLIFAAAITLDSNDEFLVFEPFYANYNAFGNLVNAKAVPVELDAKNGYHLPSDKEIISRVTSKTKAIFFTNPNNPTGTIFTEEEVRRIVRIAKKQKLFLISDETYRGICFDNKKMVSVMDVASEEEKQHIILSDSVSKRLNACGTRIGVIISKNKDVMDAAFRFAQGRLSVGYIDQEIVTPMLADSLDYLYWLTAQYEKRRDVFIGELEKELQMKIYRPEGAFYAMLQLPVENTDHFAEWLLTSFADNNETVMVAPGSGFYATKGKGKNEIRVAYVLDERKLKRAAQLLALGLKKYQQENK